MNDEASAAVISFAHSFHRDAAGTGRHLAHDAGMTRSARSSSSTVDQAAASTRRPAPRRLRRGVGEWHSHGLGALLVIDALGGGPDADRLYDADAEDLLANVRLPTLLFAAPRHARRRRPVGHCRRRRRYDQRCPVRGDDGCPRSTRLLPSSSRLTRQTHGHRGRRSQRRRPPPTRCRTRQHRQRRRAAPMRHARPGRPLIEWQPRARRGARRPRSRYPVAAPLVRHLAATHPPRIATGAARLRVTGPLLSDLQVPPTRSAELSGARCAGVAR